MGLKEYESIFKNEDSLDPEWLPKNLPYRETQHQAIANCIKPLLQGRTGRNCIISGAPGIGKTAAVKLVLKELEENPDVNAPDIYVLYVNCWQKNTTYKIFIDMCEQLGYKFTQNKNTEDLFKIIQNIVNKKSAVFAFDEIDKVEDVDFLYNIFTDILKKTVLMITNHIQWYTTVDERVRSRLLPEKIDFKPYTKEEIEGILKKRIEYAFCPGCWEDEAFNKIVETTITAGDVRAGLHLLREAGLAAEDNSSRKILPDHTQKALTKLTDFTIKPKDALPDDSKAILELVKTQSGRIGDLYKIYQDQGGKATYKTFQRRIESLEKGGFIETKKVVGGKEGTTTIITGKNKSLDEY
ncbi:AAA family ATPase [Candidatus Woesearchaeota archaeon]|nr:AAA family ATPase [Candidatus Woesearchaeota archaeon]